MNKNTKWVCPDGEISTTCLNMLNQPHLLIGGSTGSGKSVLINSLIYTAISKAPGDVNLILVDPKRVELSDYKNLPHTLRYATEPKEIIETLMIAVSTMESIYSELAKAGIKKQTQVNTYIIVDELADLLTTSKKQVLPLLQRLAQLGRAAGIHLILATQRPTKDIVSGQLKVNLDSRVALRCPTAVDSRNIINIKGAEELPQYGFGYYLTPDTITPLLIEIPHTSEQFIKNRIEHWQKQVPKKSIFTRLFARK